MLFEFPWQPAVHASVSAATPLVRIDDLIFISASYGAGAAVLKVAEKLRKSCGPATTFFRAIMRRAFTTGFLFGFDGRQEKAAICVARNSRRERFAGPWTASARAR